MGSRDQTPHGMTDRQYEDSIIKTLPSAHDTYRESVALKRRINRLESDRIAMRKALDKSAAEWITFNNDHHRLLFLCSHLTANVDNELLINKISNANSIDSLRDILDAEFVPNIKIRN